MKRERHFIFSTASMVTLLHIGIIAATWNAVIPKESHVINHLTMVDLGSIHGDNQALADGAPAPLETPKPPVQTPPAQPKIEKEKPKPIKPLKNKVNTVQRQDKTADLSKPTLPEEKIIKPKAETEKPVKTPTKTQATPTEESRSAAQDNNAPIKSKDGVNGGGQGNNPNSKAPANPASDNKQGDGKGTKGTGEKPSNHAIDPDKIVNGGYLSPPNISYPASAQDNGDEGSVSIEFVVEPNGSVSSAKILKGSGSRVLDQAALRGIRSGKYKADTINGTPVRTRFHTKVDFKII